MSEERKAVCMLCGKPSETSICTSCAQRVQGEQLGKKGERESNKG